MEVQTISSLGREPADQGHSLWQLQLPPCAFGDPGPLRTMVPGDVS